MKQIRKYLWLAVVAALVNACAGVALNRPSPQPLPADEQGRLLAQAEQALANKAYEQALSDFTSYLRQYPQGRDADRAFLGIGNIYTQKEEFDAAQAFYQRLLTDYPDSALCNEARLGIIDLLFKTQQTEQAMARAREMLQTNLTEDVRRQIWQRLVHQYESTGVTADAAAYLYLLYKSAPAEEKERWATQLQEAIGRVNDQDIEKLWDQMDDPMPRSYLMYRHATVQVVMENYGQALELLTAFVQAYPQHPYARDAAQIITTLEERLRFKPQTVGCLLPLSGPYKLYGQRALNGIELALSMWPKDEQGQQIRLEIKDSASEDGTAVQGVRELAAAGVGAIIGPIVAAPAAAQEAQKLNIPMVTFTQKPDITSVGDYIFRHFITPQSQVHALVSYFVNRVGLRDFAIMYPREAYGQTFMNLFWDEVIRQGGQVVGAEAYDPQQTDFATTIRKLIGTYYPIPKALEQHSKVEVAESPYFENHTPQPGHLDEIVPDPVTRLTGLYFQDPDQDRVRGPASGRDIEEQADMPSIDFDVLFIPDAPKTAALILPQLAYHDVRDVYLVGTNLWHSPQLIEMAKDYAQNAVMADGFSPGSTSEPVRQFVAAYQQIYGSQPGIIEAFAFDTARLLFDIMAGSGIQFRHILRDAMLQAFEVDGVTGSTAFAADGEAIKNLSLLRIKGDRFLEIPRQ
jgi:branched-chain amino acid transport system substrate-binding protein